MIKLKPIISEKKLRIFDFDGTLAKSDAQIILNKADGTQTHISGLEYAYYKLKPGESVDFREFGDEKLSQPRAIRYTIKILKNIYDRQTNLHSVYVLTARPADRTGSIRNFLNKHGLSGVDIAPMGDLYKGSSDAVKKAKWVENQINNGYTDILFFDDLPTNLQAVQNLSKKYPNVKIITRLIKPTFME